MNNSKAIIVRPRPQHNSITNVSQQLIANQVNTMMQRQKKRAQKRGEKVFSSVQAVTNINFSGTSYTLFEPTTGTALNDRINNKTIIHKFVLNISFQIGTFTIGGIVENTIHLLVIKWIDSTVAGLPSASDVLDPVTGGVGTALAPLVPVNRSQTDSQFVVLHDEIIQLDVYHPVATRSITKTCGWGSEFDGTYTGANQPVIFLISDDGVATYPTCEYVCQVLFSDDSS